jgi:hypothetical protein
MTSAYPIPTAELIERVRALAIELGAWPSQRRVMRECRVGAPRADAALAALRREGFAPAAQPVLTVIPSGAERVEDAAETHPADSSTSATDETAETASEAAEIAVEPLLIIALGAFVSIWAGWVGLGELAGFGPVRLLPGIADSFAINSAITLPLGVEA